MINIPKAVEKYLLEDEIVDKQFWLTDQIVYTSKNRLFITDGNKARDINYIHVSSIELETKPSWLGVILGIIVVSMTFMPWSESTPPGRLLMSYGTFSSLFTVGTILFGIFLIVISFKRKNHYIKLNVAGMSEKLVLKGDKGIISDLFRLVNERRFQLIPNQT